MLCYYRCPSPLQNLHGVLWRWHTISWTTYCFDTLRLDAGFKIRPVLYNIAIIIIILVACL